MSNVNVHSYFTGPDIRAVPYPDRISADAMVLYLDAATIFLRISDAITVVAQMASALADLGQIGDDLSEHLRALLDQPRDSVIAHDEGAL